MTRAVLAPGKAMLIGEYAVLEGAPAVVAAVDVYAKAVLSDRPPASPFIEAAMRHAARELSDAPFGPYPSPNWPVPSVDTTAFLQKGKKLGVGSSAAATVAATGALFSGAGLSLSDETVLARVYDTAKRAHDEAQKQSGSGADLWAATYGRVRVLGPWDRQVESRPIPAHLRFVATSTSCSTARLLARYRHVRDQLDDAIATLADAAKAFLAAWQHGDTRALLSAVEAANLGYERLSEPLSETLLTAEHVRIRDAALRAGGAAKPSGAGGGDLAVVFLPTLEAVKTFESDVETLPLSVSPVGLCLEKENPV